MIVIIRSLDNTFHYCLVPVCLTKDIHSYINHIKHTSILSLDFNLTAAEIGQILGGN